MVFDWIWMAGEILSAIALLVGAGLALLETAPFRKLFSVVSRPAAPKAAPGTTLRLT